MFARQMGQRLEREIARDNVQARRRLGQLIDDCCGQFAAGRVAAKNAGTEVQKFHEKSSKWVAGPPAHPYLALAPLPEKPLYSETIYRFIR